MSVVRLEGSAFYWMHHPATSTNVDHYTMHASSSRTLAAVKLPEGFFCMVKKLSDRRWWWRIAHLHPYTEEQKGTVADRTTAMKDAETATRKILAAASARIVGVKIEAAKTAAKERAKRSGSDSTLPMPEKTKSNGVG